MISKEQTKINLFYALSGNYVARRPCKEATLAASEDSGLGDAEEATQGMGTVAGDGSGGMWHCEEVQGGSTCMFAGTSSSFGGALRLGTPYYDAGNG